MAGLAEFVGGIPVMIAGYLTPLAAPALAYSIDPALGIPWH
jgi:hypothetical protein